MKTLLTDLISLPEVAALAGVRRPVVTTWRRRHPAFPAPAEVEAGRLLFKARDVVEWLVGTGRAERSTIEPDLRLHLLACLPLQAGVSTGIGRRRNLRRHELVGAMTALICLYHLDDEPLRPDGYTDRQMIDALRERAAEADWDDELLRSEIDTLPPDAGWLAEVVDELIEAAWGCAQAYERVLAARQRFGIPELYEDAITPQLARLMAGLSGARDRADEHGHLQVADYRAGAGDLLMAVRHELGDHDPLALHAADPDPFLARVLRRRLVVQGLSRGSWQVEIGPGPATSTSPADVVLLHLPYRPAESRTDTNPFAEVNKVTHGLAPGQTAVVLGPAELLVDALPPYHPAARSRNELLTTGRVEAVVQLPGGLVSFRPGYRTALWVLRREEPSPLQGRVLLADVSDRALTDRVVDELVVDIVTWRRNGHRPEEHLRAYASQVNIADLTPPRRPLTARRPARVRDVVRDGRLTVAEVAEMEVALDDLAGPRPRLRSRLAARDEREQPVTRSIGALVREGHLHILSGVRIAGDDAVAEGHHPLVGPDEISGLAPIGSRLIDRAVFAERYPRARPTEPGDVIVSLTPTLRAHHDAEGFSVVEFPARVVRIRPDGRARFTPRVLAALINAAPQRRAPGAVRPSSRLTDLQLPLLPPADVARLDALLTASEVRRNLARRELELLDELGRRAVAGLTDGILTIAEGALAGPPRAEEQD
ncbi:SAM-dependent methyltransferase [Micromonospora sp. MED01]|uniref:SAM-dependent methyltransferase n=1 Tax=Micromonospora alfalfae TaxID=2911212 RepID=UPI001EE8A55C|nr:SAM-dependent methyltransferase [Micromonospora alfalfae]MCG5463445.1 SAM-dependent methyltransferase [Micromonospora alfalfae]